MKNVRDNKKNSKIYKAHLAFAIYIILILIERTYSMVRSIFDSSAGMFNSVINLYPYILCLITLAIGIIVLFKTNADLVKGIKSKDEILHKNINTKTLSITFGLMFFASLINTANTIILVHVIAYCTLYVGLALQLLFENGNLKRAGLFLFAVCYLFFFYAMINLAVNAKISNTDILSLAKTAITFLFSATVTFLISKSVDKGKTDYFVIIPMIVALGMYIFIMEM